MCELEEYNLPSSPGVPILPMRAGWQSAAAAGLMLTGVAGADGAFSTRRSTSD